MRQFHARCLALALVIPALSAQGAGETPASSAANSRQALIKQSLARDHGEITAMEPSSVDGRGVILGYSSGSVVNCYGENSCQVMDGTPSSAVVGEVSDIAVSRRGARDVIWVAYPHGVLYRCTDGFCREFRGEGIQRE